MGYWWSGLRVEAHLLSKQSRQLILLHVSSCVHLRTVKLRHLDGDTCRDSVALYDVVRLEVGLE